MRLPILVALTLMNSAVPTMAEVPLFTEPPAPEALAELLFKPRFRSVDGAQEENLFAMRIQFEFDSTAVLPQSIPLLDSVGEMMTLPAIGNRAVIVEGHTDAKGTEAYNDDLSRRRAGAIKRYLADSFAIDESRLVITGKGETNLYDHANPRAAVNRRVVFRPLQKIRLK